MSDVTNKVEDQFRYFREREKELEGLYRVEGILQRSSISLEEAYNGVVQTIPPAWQYPDCCQANITFGANSYHTASYQETPWKQKADIIVEGKKEGEISVCYMKEMPAADEGPFLKQETRLLEAIAGRIGRFVSHRRVKQTVEEYRVLQQKSTVGEWRVILDLIRNTDKILFKNMSDKMLNHLFWSGVAEARDFREMENPDEATPNSNAPSKWTGDRAQADRSEEIFKVAAKYFSDDQITADLQKWIQDNHLKFLARVEDGNLPLAEVIDAIRRYRSIAAEGIDLSPYVKRAVRVSLINRFFSDRLQYVNVAKNFIEIQDYFDLLERIIYIAESRGRLGGKVAGLFLAAQILKKAPTSQKLLGQFKTPKSWHLTSDLLVAFMVHNNLDELLEQKYKDINQIRQEYPHVVRTFKSGRFSPEIIQGLSMAMDEFGEKPLIVRSSSLLEDGPEAAFSGKYKSLFLANQGSKKERLAALVDGIAEVYASTFGPDPIEYRAERGLLDFNEGMGIVIQEVVGARVGDYFFPAFSGVAFSRNEFRWSPRIKREDGLIRIVPGLGTRAVDRVGDDYPVLIAPGQPGLRVNVTVDEITYYAPRKIDVINLKTNSFETLETEALLKAHGNEFPLLEKIVSVHDGHGLRTPLAMSTHYEQASLAVTFEGLISDSSFIPQVNGMLKLLEASLGTPVDIEFAHDGKDFYLLQCRSQIYSEDSAPAQIPRDMPKEKIVFSANRYISNGRVPDITHIVYVDPRSYSELSERSELLDVGRAVGRLNQRLPKRQFILMGPGRWGSRGEIKLGVNVTYSDISNTAVLVEIARKQGNYLPDLSFGTHFFQDLVEAGIRYLPLYPDDESTVFNEQFLLGSPNALSDVLPECATLAGTIHLIDIPAVTYGLVLRVLMNAELNEAVGFLTHPGPQPELPPRER